jgi:hypothetical protein
MRKNFTAKDTEIARKDHKMIATRWRFLRLLPPALFAVNHPFQTYSHGIDHARKFTKKRDETAK